MKQVHVLRVVVASPGDVQPERNALVEVAEELNRGIAGDRALRIDISRWETDVYPGFHIEGPQGLIDLSLSIEDCDLLIGIFWKRFGTPTVDAKSGTEHEFRKAYEAWKRNNRPQLMIYFKEKPYWPKASEEIYQLGLVFDFRHDFPPEGLWSTYTEKSQFVKLVRNHLTQFIRTISVSDGTSNNSNTIPIEMKDEQASLAAQELENKGVVSNDRDEEQFDGTNELTESLQLEENMLNMSALTVQQVNDAWENVRKRTKQKSTSGLTAAYLGYYKVIAIEGTPEQPIVVIQAAKQAHYEYVKMNDRYKDLEWALDMEFSLPCRVRLVPPNAIPLTVQQVKDAWEDVRKRTRQKTPSGTMAAMLGLYKILDVEGTAEQPVVVIQSEKQAHYKYVKDEDRYKILEWALEMEFNRPCRVRLVPPNAIPQTQNPSKF